MERTAEIPRRVGEKKKLDKRGKKRAASHRRGKQKKKKIRLKRRKGEGKC